jgi:hypothetical protein
MPTFLRYPAEPVLKRALAVRAHVKRLLRRVTFLEMVCEYYF